MTLARILGIETSCDESAAAVVAEGTQVLSNVVASQVDFHQKYGGVVPEIASRKHLEALPYVIEEALAGAGLAASQVDGIAVTAGPGLEGSLLVGVSTAKALAAALEKPLLGVHHVEAHLYANFLDRPNLRPPLLCLVASGGHSDLIALTQHCRYQLVAVTRDDAAGEALDKVGRLLGLPYPAGPHMDRLARSGNRERIRFPRARLRNSLDFSFSGLKTAAYRHISSLTPQQLEAQRADICASFQEAVVEPLVEHTLRAAHDLGFDQVCASGGVAANSRLRESFERRCRQEGMTFVSPPAALCTDNAAMVAAAGFFRARLGLVNDLYLDVDANMPLPAGDDRPI